MQIAITGGAGLVGRFITDAALAAGHAVTILSRHAPPPRLFRGPVAHRTHDLTRDLPDLRGADLLVHAAFRHEPGKYRGGEGADAAGFRAANLDGSLRLFRAAADQGVGRVVFLSSRAVYDGLPSGTPLTEDMRVRPDTLYGQVKVGAEAALMALQGPGFVPLVLRATGVYGPGPDHKWTTLFTDFLAGRDVPPRVATEVHGDDLAAAVLLLAGADLPGGIFNASDLVLDRHDLLAEVARLADCTTPLPPRAEMASLGAMDSSRLRTLGWTPGGWPRLLASLPAMLPA